MEKASSTADMVAAFRARATNKPSPVCNDPYAAILAGADGQAHATEYEKAVPAIELWVALRTARLDDSTREAIASGIGQIVILGAGLDTRAARLASSGVRFFEVDTPQTQREKLARLAKLDGYPIAAATYVECDFETDDFLDRLVASGFDAAAPAFFIWEGVTYYLPEEAVRATLVRLASGTHPESVVAFDFFGNRFVKSELRDEMDRAARNRVAEMGEPLRSGFTDLVPVLYECGFRKVHVEPFDEIALNYLGDYERARKFRFQSIAWTSRARRVP